jgi:hypothetical protein
MIDPGERKVYVRNPDVVLREDEPDGGLLFNPDTNQIRVLNPTGLFLWKNCDGTREMKDLVEALRAEFESVPEGEVQGQVTSFMEDMVANGFIGTNESRKK